MRNWLFFLFVIQLQASSVPLPSNDELSQNIQETLEKAPALNVYRMMANVPESFEPYMAFAKSIFDGKLDPKLREIIFLRVAQNLNSTYEWHQHVFLAKASGLTDGQIAIIRKENPVKSLQDEQNFICKVSDELTRNAKLSDATFNELFKRYSTELGCEIILCVSFSNLLSRFINGTGVEIEKTNPLEGLTSPTQ